MTALSLAERLQRIDALESEFVRKSSNSIGLAADLGHADFFLFGALRRTLAQARGFRELISARNFPCAAAILRLQLDTAMRINALSLFDDIDEACRMVLNGQPFNKLKGRDGKRLSDAVLREYLARDYPWIDPVYVRTSDFVHLSGRHFDISIARADDATRIAHFQFSGHDPDRPEEAYFDIVDSFFEATRLASMLILAVLTARHQPHRLTAGMTPAEPEQ